jgi:hypothetical protein
MKTLFWNIGILLIRLGYIVRDGGKGHTYNMQKSNLRWHVGKTILGIGYWIRGEVPKRHWF